MSVPPDDQTRAWVAAWKERGKALEEVRKQELRALTEEEAGRLFAKMAFDPGTMWISPERAESAGFIEQQRIFMRSHEHPARHRRRF